MLNLLDKKILFYLLETFYLKHFILYPRDLKNPICLIFQDLQAFLPGSVAQSVTCLATDGSLTAYPWVPSSIPAQSHTSVEIDHEIISYGHSPPFR